MGDDLPNEATNLPALPDDPGQFILYQTEDGQTRVEVRVFREMVWLSQRVMAELFQKDVRTIKEHVRNVFSEGELQEPAVIRKFRITASDGRSSPWGQHTQFNPKEIRCLSESKRCPELKAGIQPRYGG